MPKTQEELTQLKEEYETLNNKLKELSEDELKMVTGGSPNIPPLPQPVKNHNDGGTTKYRCKDCGHEYIRQANFGGVDDYYLGNDDAPCDKCGSYNRERLGILVG